jgi:predicted dehydrogenase
LKKIKMALVGVGRGTAYGSIFAQSPRAEVVALCDVDSESLAANGKDFNLSDAQLFTDYDSMIQSDIDAVFVGTPIPNHAAQVVSALESGRHVLSEVTAADTLEGCMQIVDAVRKSKASYMMAENCNYMHFAQEWKKLIDAGNLGRLHYAEADYVHEIRSRVADKWRAGRPPLAYCSHSLGPLLYWMDDYIVKATAAGRDCTILPGIGVGAIDMQVALFETHKGAIIKVLRSSVATRHPPLCTYSIYGTKGALESGRTLYDNTGRRYLEGIDADEGVEMPVSSSDPDAPEAAKLGGHGTSEYYLAKDFLDAIEFGCTPPIDVVKAMDMTVPGLIAHEAAMKGNIWLDVPRITD